MVTLKKRSFSSVTLTCVVFNEKFICHTNCKITLCTLDELSNPVNFITPLVKSFFEPIAKGT